MILVAGATGVLGGLVCQRLRDRREAVRALVRASSDPARKERLRAMGVELAEGDLRDRASLDAACRGADTVVSTVSMIVTGMNLDDPSPAAQLSVPLAPVKCVPLTAVPFVNE